MFMSSNEFLSFFLTGILDVSGTRGSLRGACQNASYDISVYLVLSLRFFIFLGSAKQEAEMWFSGSCYENVVTKKRYLLC